MRHPYKPSQHIYRPAACLEFSLSVLTSLLLRCSIVSPFIRRHIPFLLSCTPLYSALHSFFSRIYLRIYPLFPGGNAFVAWEKSLTMISHRVSRHKSRFACGGTRCNNSSPALRSTASTGTWNCVRGVESSMAALGNTKAPTAKLSLPSLSPTMSLKKCVGTATFGGDPTTS